MQRKKNSEKCLCSDHYNIALIKTKSLFDTVLGKPQKKRFSLVATKKTFLNFVPNLK